jgi:hypothetical protein
MPQGPSPPALPSGTPRLRRVFDDNKIRTLGQGHEGIHVRRPARCTSMMARGRGVRQAAALAGSGV